MSTPTGKVFNQEVTRGLLVGWASQDIKGNDGIWHWNLVNQTTAPQFEAGKRAKFAGVNYLYVGNDGGQPIDTSIEDGLARYESELARLAQALWKKNLRADKAGITTIAKGLPAIFGYVNRGAWSVLGTGSFLSLSDEGRIAYLDDQLTVAARSFAGWDFKFFQDSQVPLLICDSPLFDLRVTADRLPGVNPSVCVMPLGPRAAVVARKSDRPVPKVPPMHWSTGLDVFALNIGVSVSAQPLPRSMADFCNGATIQRARRWVVASSVSELQAHSTALQPAEVRRRVQTDTMAVLVEGQLSHRIG